MSLVSYFDPNNTSLRYDRAILIHPVLLPTYLYIALIKILVGLIAEKLIQIKPVINFAYCPKFKSIWMLLKRSLPVIRAVWK